jgi:FAD/FMN-containing dehydrogenase
MNRRGFLRQLAAIPALSLLWPRLLKAAQPVVPRKKLLFRRVRPSDPSWPAAAAWEKLKNDVGGNLIKVKSPLAACISAPDGKSCDDVFKLMKNPYYIADQPGLTQTSGWADAWTSTPSAYAVAARTTADVVAGVNFARENNLRLVVKGGGHSYQGTSNAADSLLIWTRAMNKITLHNAFVGQGCEGKQAPQPAVTVEAGAMWMHVYDEVTTKAARYVQGGGCATVGVAGLVQSGGFSPFSKNYGTAAAGLLEAEIVTADGAVRIANPCTNPDLFWGIKGGGGGSLGVVTRLTLRTRELPDFIGAVFNRITAKSDAAFQRLIAEFIRFYRTNLFNPHWGNIVHFAPDNSLTIEMLFQGLDKADAQDIWRPFFDFLENSPEDFGLESRPLIVRLFDAIAGGLSGRGFSIPYGAVIFDMPAKYWWDARVWRKYLPGGMVTDDRQGAPESNVYYAANLQEVGWFIQGYQSAWMPASLLKNERQKQLADALYASSRYCEVALHFNKGLAGGSAEAIAATRDTAMSPAVLDAFALAVIAEFGPPAFPDIPGHEPDLAAARKSAAEIDKSMNELRKIAPDAGAYVAESNFFEASWQHAFWGTNYPKLQAVKKKYDPQGLFFVHHGVGSEEWSADGFTRLTRG